MSRKLLQFGLAGVGSLTLLMSAIFVLPYDDRGLRLLSGEMDCVKLCFLDIHPGVTPVAEALDRLGSSAWVTDIQLDTKRQLIRWSWTGLQPPEIDSSLHPILEYNQDVVLRIHLFTHIPLGEVILRWANVQRQPSISTIGRVANLNAVRMAYYLGNGYAAAIQLECHDFWRSPTILILGANIRYVSSFGRTRYELTRFKRIFSAQCI